MNKFFLVVVLAISSFLLPGCDWIRAQLGMATSIELEVARKKNIVAATELAQINALKTAKIDSLALEVKDSVRNVVVNRFHIIMGSFKDSTNARKMADLLTKNGYKPTLFLSKNGSTMVSASSFNNQSEANKELNNLLEKDFTPDDIWVYETNQKFH